MGLLYACKSIAWFCFVFCEPNHTVQMVLADLRDMSYIYDNYVWSKLFILARIKKAKIVYFQILKLQNNKITKSTELII